MLNVNSGAQSTDGKKSIFFYKVKKQKHVGENMILVKLI
jgi:hypothetical protein